MGVLQRRGPKNIHGARQNTQGYDAVFQTRTQLQLEVSAESLKSDTIVTCHSERKWKEKMQEWGFEKNIPAKEMKFMATKAWKRELEEGKETLFCRNGTVVDRGKVEMFKKQKLNSENSFVIRSIPGEFCSRGNAVDVTDINRNASTHIL
jgi:hypothetical protein